MRMSALFSSVLILQICRMLDCASCCMKRCLSSMCFAFFELPILVVMDFPAEESVQICSVIFMLLPKVSVRK